MDAARLAEELRAEQDHVTVQSKNKHTLETQMADMENRFAEANESAMRGGKSAMAKLESRIRDLEIELGNVGLHWGQHEGPPEGREEDQGARVPERRRQEEPGPHGRAGLQAAGQDQDLQEADRGGRGDRRPQPVEDVLARSNGLLELLALSHLAGVPVDQEALGPTQFLDHGLGQEVEHSGQGDKLAGLHDGRQVFASFRAGGDLLPEKVAR